MRDRDRNLISKYEKNQEKRIERKKEEKIISQIKYNKEGKKHV